MSRLTTPLQRRTEDTAARVNRVRLRKGLNATRTVPDRTRQHENDRDECPSMTRRSFRAVDYLEQGSEVMQWTTSGR